VPLGCKQRQKRPAEDAGRACDEDSHGLVHRLDV
jgi:hypothetical protein